MNEKKSVGEEEVGDINDILNTLNGKSLTSIVSVAASLLAERRSSGYHDILLYLSKMENVSITMVDCTPPVMEISLSGIDWLSACDLIKEISQRTQYSGISMSAGLSDADKLEFVETTLELRSPPGEITEKIPKGSLYPLEDFLEKLS